MDVEGSESNITPGGDAGNKKVNPLVYFGGTTGEQGVPLSRSASSSSVGKKVFVGVVVCIVIATAAYFLLTKVFDFALPFTIPTFGLL